MIRTSKKVWRISLQNILQNEIRKSSEQTMDGNFKEDVRIHTVLKAIQLDVIRENECDPFSGEFEVIEKRIGLLSFLSLRWFFKCRS